MQTIQSGTFQAVLSQELQEGQVEQLKTIACQNNCHISFISARKEKLFNDQLMTK